MWALQSRLTILKESGKKDKYLDIAREYKRLWNMEVTVIPIVIGALGTVTKGLVYKIMMLYKNTKVKVCSLDGDTDYFDIVAGVLQGDTLAPYLFIICLDSVLQTSIDLMKENGFKQEKKKKMKQKITSYYGRRLRRWPSASGKYNHPSRIPATWSGTGSR